jgi:hypothetical protein
LLVRPATEDVVTTGIALTRLDPLGYVLISRRVAVLAETDSQGPIERGDEVVIARPIGEDLDRSTSAMQAGERNVGQTTS